MEVMGLPSSGDGRTPGAEGMSAEGAEGDASGAPLKVPAGIRADVDDIPTLRLRKDIVRKSHASTNTTWRD